MRVRMPFALRGYRARRLRARIDAALDDGDVARALAEVENRLGEHAKEFFHEYLTSLGGSDVVRDAHRISSILASDVLDASWQKTVLDAALTSAERSSTRGDASVASQMLTALLERRILDRTIERRVTRAAVAHLKKVLADPSETPEALARALVTQRPGYAQGVLYLEETLTRLRREAEALELLRAAISADPDDPRYVSRLASRLYDASEVVEADRLVASFIQTHPGDEIVLRSFVRRLFWRQRFGDAVGWLEAALLRRPSQQLLAYLVEAHLGQGDVASARVAVRRAATEGRLDPREGWAEARILAAEGRLDEAIAHLEELRDRTPETDAGHATAAAELSPLLVRKQTGQILRAVPSGGEIAGVAVLVTHGAPLSLVWMGLIALEMRKRGFAIVILEQAGVCAIPATGDRDIDDLQGIIATSGKHLRGESVDHAGLRHDWTIDPRAGVVGTEGFNFYQHVMARIGTVMRRLRFDVDHPLAQEVLDDNVRRADAMLTVCERIAETLGKRHIPVRFLAGMSHYLPAAVPRLFSARNATDLDMQYVAFEAAYQHYYDNMADTTSTALSVANVTRHPELNKAGSPRRDRFDAWLADLPSDRRRVSLREVSGIVAVDRARVRVDRAAEDALRRIREHRTSGRPVVCLLGKVLYDVWVDEPSGVVHRDMVDWVRHSVESVRGSETLLLIKPHPDEVKRQLARPMEFFMDLLDTDLPDQALALDHRWFNLHQLVPLIDCGVMWSGTSALELHAAGLPAVVCSRAGLADYPVSFWAPGDRGEYEEMLRAPRELQVTPESMERCALLIKYLSTPEVNTPYPYALMPSLRGTYPGPIHWKMDRVERYLSEGDPHITALAERCL